jgi:hypothetical protein
MGGLVLVGTIAAGVGLALLTAKWSLALLIQHMPQRKR